MSLERQISRVLERVLERMLEPLVKKTLDHLFMQVGEHGIIEAAWVDDLPSTKETLQKVSERIQENAKAKRNVGNLQEVPRGGVRIQAQPGNEAEDDGV